MNRELHWPRQVRVLFLQRGSSTRCGLRYTLMPSIQRYVARLLRRVSFAKCDPRRALAPPHPRTQLLKLCYAMAPLGPGFTHGKFHQFLALQPRSPNFSHRNYFQGFNKLGFSLYLNKFIIIFIDGLVSQPCRASVFFEYLIHCRFIIQRTIIINSQLCISEQSTPNIYNS